MSNSKGFVKSIANTMAQVRCELQLESIKEEHFEKVIKLDPQLISNWEFRDRQDFELGDILGLAESIETKGQAQPIIIVYADDMFKSVHADTSKYIVIAGYRRWLACKEKNIAIDAIIRKMSFEQAIACLVSENEKERVSDYSKGMFYHSLLMKEKVTKKILYEKLKINRCVFDNYLSFADVPKEVWTAVKDMSRVSARTSSTIKSICQKGKKETEAVIAIADKISLGIGEKKINTLINEMLYEDNKRLNCSATRVAFAKNVFIDIGKDSLVVTAKKIKKDDLILLQRKFNEILKNFLEETN